LAGLVVALGSAWMIALNTVLTVGPGSLPPFGPVSVALLCLPYPMAFALLRVRCRRVVAATVAATPALAVLVVPLRRGQEGLAADAWRRAHPATAHVLLRGVRWPNGRQSEIGTGR
jgi:hypothetical protein